MKATEVIAKAIDDGCVTAGDMGKWSKEFDATIDRMFEATTIPEFSRENFGLIDYTGKSTDQNTNFDNKEINSYMEE